MNIKKNEKISFDNIISLRPVIGIKSENIFKIIAKVKKILVKIVHFF